MTGGDPRQKESVAGGAASTRLRSPDDLDALRWDADGLVPVVAQDARTGDVLMVAWADRSALERTLDQGYMHYWSRSRQELWRKGDTSGNVQRVLSLHSDCDSDTVLARVDPAGPACHTGEATCFRRPPADILAELWQVLEDRRESLPEGSYTTRLLQDENLRLKKLGEEATELVLALKGETDRRTVEEAADLVYHLLTALVARGVTLDGLRAELASRRPDSSDEPRDQEG